MKIILSFVMMFCVVCSPLSAKTYGDFNDDVCPPQYSRKAILGNLVAVKEVAGQPRRIGPAGKPPAGEKFAGRLWPPSVDELFAQV